ncbi:MAG: hypothetical protein IAG13_16875, partial [Deltaproteobacteria bacterium]|nr:hypothetical protein [Nannocystaceae bacterium]
PPVGDPRTRVLASLLLRLHAIASAARPWPSHEQRRCYRELRELPLLALPNGRAISLDVALRERPRALADAGLWNDDGRELDAADDEAEDARDDEQTTAPEPASAVQQRPAPPVPVARSVDIPEQSLARAVRDELRLLRGRDEPLFAEMYVERVTVERVSGELVAVARDGAVVLDAAHPVVARALARPEPLLVSLLASAALTVLNLVHESLTDEQEAQVLAHHVAHLRTAGPQAR